MQHLNKYSYAPYQTYYTYNGTQTKLFWGIWPISIISIKNNDLKCHTNSPIFKNSENSEQFGKSNSAF